MASPGERLVSLEAGIPLPFPDAPSISVDRRRSKRRANEPPDVTPSPNKKKRVYTAPALETGELSGEDKKRLAWLERQPLAKVLDMLVVQCKRCGQRIKLSQRCLYDPQHWKKHRERCDRWSDAETARRRAQNGMVASASRSSTPSLTSDDESELTGTSALSQITPSPPPEDTRTPALSSPGLLTSHVLCAEYFATGYPDLEVVDLNVPISAIPEWSHECLRAPAFAKVGLAEVVPETCTLTPAVWDEDGDEDETREDDFNNCHPWVEDPPTCDLMRSPLAFGAKQLPLGARLS